MVLIIQVMATRATQSRRPNAPKTRRLPAWAAHVPGPQDPLPDEVEQFLDWMRVQRNRPATTVRAYRQDLAKFVAYMRTRPIGDRFCSGLDRSVLRGYQIELAGDGRTSHVLASGDALAQRPLQLVVERQRRGGLEGHGSGAGPQPAPPRATTSPRQCLLVRPGR